MIKLKYQYDVQIMPSASFLPSMLAKQLPGCVELSITSRHFDDYGECEGNLSRLLALLGSLESRASGKNFVVISQSNPAIDDGKIITTETSWEPGTVFKSFVVDADHLDQSEFGFSVIAQFKVNTDNIRAQSSDSMLTYSH